MKPILLFAIALSFGVNAFPQNNEAASPLVDRVGQTGFLQLEADSFNSLPPKQKALAFWLSMAAIAVNPIVYDHNSFTSEKFLPDFTPEELETAALIARKNRAELGTQVNLTQELKNLNRAIFDPSYQSSITVKNPKAGVDPLVASGNNLYQDVTTADLKDFHDAYPLNSKLVKRDGKLVEEVYRAGGAGKPPGLYAEELGRAIRYFNMAMPFAPPSTQKVLRDLILYYQTGDPADWRQFNIDWVRDDNPVDFTNGFIEVYKDPRGLKGAMQAYVTVVDQKMNDLMKQFAANAKYFEERDPWDDKYKLEAPHPPVVNTVEAVIETADFDVTTIGENLPNEAEIHDKYGSKSFIFTGSTRAFNAATGSKVSDEFAYSEEEKDRARKYAAIAEDMQTAMHEVLGHGSGKMDPKLTQEPAVYLKEYYSTLEEARADLVALWDFFDPKLIEMGAIPNIEAAKAEYDIEARAALTQLRAFPTGDTIEEDHRRGTQLIVNYVREKTGAIQPVERDGKIYLVVKDYDAMHKGIGMLLAELMRIKAEGDYDAAKALIDQYGIHFNPAWRDQVVQRYKGLDLPTFWSGVNPDLVPGRTPTDIHIQYPRDFVKQQLRYVVIAQH
jgi:dipeptidyl-peptidase-3